MSEPNESIRPKIDVAAAKESIKHAQERGTWPTLQKTFTPPFTEPFPQVPPRTHEQAMESFHRIEKEYQNQAPPRTHEEAMASFHKIEEEYQKAQPLSKPSQIEQTPTPVVPKNRSIRERLLDWLNKP